MDTSVRLKFAALPLALSLIAAGGQPTPSAVDPDASRLRRDVSPLVQKVRKATEQYRDINVAIAEGWVQATPCVSGPNFGAMGVHFVLPARVNDGKLNAEAPEALIYEPTGGGGT